MLLAIQRVITPMLEALFRAIGSIFALGDRLFYPLPRGLQSDEEINLRQHGKMLHTAYRDVPGFRNRQVVIYLTNVRLILVYRKLWRYSELSLPYHQIWDISVEKSKSRLIMAAWVNVRARDGTFLRVEVPGDYAARSIRHEVRRLRDLSAAAAHAQGGTPPASHTA